MNPKHRTLLGIALVAMMLTVGSSCPLASLFSSVPTATPTATKTPTPPFTATPMHTPTPTETHTPAVADTPTASATARATDTPTSVPVPPTATPRPPLPTATPRRATPTAAPTWEFVYLENSMLAEQNCGSVYLEGEIVGVGGEPVDGVTVRLRWWDNEDYDQSGAAGGHSPGKWGFSPLSPDQNQRYQPFILDVVESQANPAARSEELRIDMVDCSQAGQFTNITFAYNR